jgi:prohibitin 1
MRKHFNIFASILAITTMSSCAIIRPGEIGIKQKLGRLSNEIHERGPVAFNPFVSRVLKVPIQTNNLELNLTLPSKEGLSVNSQISILYKLDKSKVPDLIREIGLNYEVVISNVFRSASADVCAQYSAKDLHSGVRTEIEKSINTKMMETLRNRGIEIEAVLMKSIQLPAGLANSIEQKLQAEQEVMRMDFILKQTKLEAERKNIEAKGISDAQKILADGLSDKILTLRSIEAFIELSKSANSKIIITDGKTPFLIDNNITNK